MVESTADQPLPQLFANAQERFAQAESGSGTRSTRDALKLQALSLLSACDDAVERLSLFSSNEDKDDLVTSDLKYLSVPFLAGELHASSPTLDMASRADALRRSNACYLRFLHRIRQYGLLDANCYTALERLEAGEPLDSTTTRTQKIAMYKREREVKSQLAALTQQHVAAARSGAITAYDSEGRGVDDDADGAIGGGGGARGECSGDGQSAAVDEEGERESWLLQLDLYSLKAIAQLAAAEQELEVLVHAQSLPPDQRRSPTNSGDTTPPPALMAKLMAASGKLTGPRTLSRRELLRPMHQQPSRSLAQQADIEMADARTTAERQAAAEAEREAAGSTDEDDEDARRQERARDDWKDDHPFGYGNSKLRPTA